MRFNICITLCAALVFSATLYISTSVSAQQVTPQVMAHAKKIASICPGSWEKQSCLEAVSESNITLAGNYAQSLDNTGNSAQIEPLKQLCAASTAATKGEYPAEAMNSAFTECANGIYDISQQSGVAPDQSNYQLLVAAILCLSKDPQCALLERSMIQGAAR